MACTFWKSEKTLYILLSTAVLMERNWRCLLPELYWFVTDNSDDMYWIIQYEARFKAQRKRFCSGSKGKIKLGSAVALLFTKLLFFKNASQLAKDYSFKVSSIFWVWSRTCCKSLEFTETSPQVCIPQTFSWELSSANGNNYYTLPIPRNRIESPRSIGINWR